MSQHFNELLNSEHERLALLAEELGEAIQIIGKILRHGYESYSPLDMDMTSNRRLLEREIGDVEFAIELMLEHGDIDEFQLNKRKAEKRKKIGRYLHHNEVSAAAAKEGQSS